MSARPGAIDTPSVPEEPFLGQDQMPATNSDTIQAIQSLEIPDGTFRTLLLTMSPDLQRQVLEQVAKLEIPENDFESLRVHPSGKLYYICSLDDGLPLISKKRQEAGQSAGADVGASQVAASVIPVSSPPVFHSRPGASKILFLDFNGAVVTNTAWNSDPIYGEPSWDCRPYALDGDDLTFSMAEQQAIQTIWERVAEDYAPFDVDVTTEQPAAWTRNTGHVLITPGVDKNGVACPHDGYGGIAFLDVFGDVEYSYDYAGECFSPAWVLNYELNGYAEFEAEAAAHEMGHNLALSHDGTKSSSYYGGHENGSIGWGPIMGTGYTRDVSQWSKGDYRLSNNSQDDLSIIASQLSYRPDDFGDTDGTASPLSMSLTGTVFQAGVVERNTDADVFEFYAYSGSVEIAVSPYRDATSTTWGGNLDTVLELYDAGGALITMNNPELETTAALSVPVDSGVYYLHVKSTGVGDPLAAPVPSGYVQYGSLGQYTLTGTVSVNPDLDADGLPNDWELLYFSSPTGAVASMDSDGDGLENGEEYISGHVPIDSNSVFQIVSVSRPMTGSVPFIVTWDAFEGRVYHVDGVTNLVSGTFTNISGDLPYPANSYTDVVERVSPQYFYRLDVRLNQ